MNLTKNQTITIVLVFVTAILGIIGNVLVREWYQPYIKYSEGSYYISGTGAVTALMLENLGHGDARQIVVNVKFGENILDISSDQPAHLTDENIYGENNNTALINIDRLVPDQQLSIFFAIKGGSLNFTNTNYTYVTGITFNGGMGRTKNPLLPSVITNIIVIFVGILMMVALVFQAGSDIRKDQEGFNTAFPVILEMATRETLEGGDEESFGKKLDEYLKGKRPRDRLRQMGMAIFRHLT